MTKQQIFTGKGGMTAQVIEHSLHPSNEGKPLGTLQLRYPRFIHAEFMTHRVFSRNASSSRAIPVAKMLEQVRNEPAMPIHWGKNQPGMQAREEHDALVHISDGYGCNRAWAASVQDAWKQAAQNAADIAEAMSEAGYHKQVANRILEPFQFISVIVTTTEWDNFFQLRDHEDAQPEIRELAIQMKQALAASTPKRLNYGEWHLPYVSQEERRYYATDSLRKLSAARCARVSYLTHDGREPNPEEDFKLFDRLVGSVPLHASPIEHQATPDHYEATGFFTNPSGFAHPELWGNFKTWVQHRKVWEQAIFAQSNQGNNA